MCNCNYLIINNIFLIALYKTVINNNYIGHYLKCERHPNTEIDGKKWNTFKGCLIIFQWFIKNDLFPLIPFTNN
jgi:hypothetical protein